MDYIKAELIDASSIDRKKYARRENIKRIGEVVALIGIGLVTFIALFL